MAHEFADIFLRRTNGEINAKEYLAQRAKLELHELYKEEMDDYVDIYTNYVLSQFKEKGGVLLIEQKVDLTKYIEGGFGSNDAIIIADGEMEVIDLKYGKGLRVDADENKQLMLYGLGALRKYDLSYDIKSVRLTIVQPRLDHISTWVISAKDLREWGEQEVKPKAKMAYAGEGEFVAGDHCRFCKIKHKCRKLRDKAMELAKHDFADPKTLTDEEVFEAYKASGLVSDWISSLTAYVMEQANTGKKWPGHKLVEGRSRRVWTDTEEVAKVLLGRGHDADKVFDTKLKGIGAVEKLVGKSNFNSIVGVYVTKNPGKPTLVPDSDKRPALGLESAKNDFC